MDEIADEYRLETLEQMRAIADELRMRIVDALSNQAMTVTQLGEWLGQSPAKVHYHVRELERVGLVRLVETREKGGILEKYYRAVAKSLAVSRDLMNRLPPDDTVAAMSAFLRTITDGALDALRREIRSDEGFSQVDVLMAASLWATDDERREITRKIRELIVPFEKPRGVAGEREHMFAQLTYTLPSEAAADDVSGEADTAGDTAGDTAHAADATGAQVRTSARSQAKRQRVVVAGSVTYTRSDLEGVLARGTALHVTVFGSCVFTDDVSPEQIDRAIQRFHLRGKLIASNEVRAALKRKARSAAGWGDPDSTDN
jgi:DNA-binding transcriptional ArsR family regulator